MADPSRPLSRNDSRNRIIGSLPAEEYARLAPHLERVEPELRAVLFDVDQPIEHVYFPEAMVVSLLSVMADGTAIETATVGREGMAGLAVFFGTDQTSAQAFAQVPGATLRMPAGTFRDLVAELPALTRGLNRYAQALFTLIAQGSACNRLHTMPERCARWLLHTQDRVEREEFPLTHQFLSQMLGVRRATVTQAMGTLQARGTVDYGMGRVSVRDRVGLEAAACECYAIIAREFDRLLGGADATVARSPLDGVVTAEGGRSVVGDGAPRASADEPARSVED